MKLLNIKSTLLLAVALIFSASAFAQNYSFMVLGVKGSNEIDGKPIKVGSQLASAQTVNVGDDSYLGLAHSSGRTLEIKKKGDYKVADLETKLEKLNDNTTGQIAMFIIDELTSDDSKSNRFSQSRVKTGSVKRATPNQSPLQIMLPEQSEFIPGKITVKWYLDDDKVANAPEKYTFVAVNLRSEEVIREEVTGNSVTLDLSELNAFDAKLLKYQVVAEGVKSGEFGLKTPRSSEEIEKLSSELAQLPAGDSPINHYLRAEFYAKHGLLANAISSYEAAGDAFQDSYDEFLKAFKLSKEARASSSSDSDSEGE